VAAGAVAAAAMVIACLFAFVAGTVLSLLWLFDYLDRRASKKMAARRGERRCFPPGS
jgi:uncharacterized membrane protein